MLKLKPKLFFVLVALVLSSCSSWKQNDYHGAGQQTTQEKPITVPPDLTVARMEPYYPIPDVVYQREQQSATLTTPPADATPGDVTNIAMAKSTS